MFLRRRGAGISWASVSPSQVVWRPLEAIWRRLGVCWAPRWGRQTPYRAGEEGKHAGSPRRQMTMRGTGRRQIWKGVEARGWRTDSMLWQREALAGRGWRRVDLGGRRHGGGRDCCSRVPLLRGGNESCSANLGRRGYVDEVGLVG
jgi:hypothetical protein